MICLLYHRFEAGSPGLAERRRSISQGLHLGGDSLQGRQWKPVQNWDVWYMEYIYMEYIYRIYIYIWNIYIYMEYIWNIYGIYMEYVYIYMIYDIIFIIWYI